jgi:uncharacterized membrane protein
VSGLVRTLTVAGAVGAGVAGGVFFAFSTFVTAALRRLPPAQGITAMQAINKAAPTPWFMTALFGTAAVCIALGVLAVRDLGRPGAALRLAGSALYLAGTLLTITYHVPRNDALALVDPTAVGAADEWTRYLSGWIAWNHVRTVTSLGGGLGLILAARAD